ncbi:MAG: protein kinase domain-containing protein [Cellulomonas sp.]
MSQRRTPSAPPAIDGFEYISLLGSGGFADVFLYEQHRPRRRVAVKVLLADLLQADALERFDSEANRMAQLSTHPSIVTIYEADVAADGRPYLAMEYCSRPSLAHAYRREPLGVAEVLRIGIQVAGAVETAHRAGILHRDIKPANILITEYNRPALTDFGISGATDGAVVETEGMSIPWSPPESFADPPHSGVATDVWALAATVYTLLAGRSPFEIPRGANTGADLISRIERSVLSTTGRSDVPASLERVLATAMAKRPEARYPTVLSMAQAWQQVQTELQLSVTAIDVLDDAVFTAEPEPDDEPGTRIRQVVSVDPTGPRPAPSQRRPAPTLPPAGLRDPAFGDPAFGDPAAGETAADHTVLRGAVPVTAPARGPVPPSSGPTAASRPAPREPVPGLPAPAVEQTVQRPGDPAGSAEPDAPAATVARRGPARYIAGGVLAVVLVVATGFALRPGAEPEVGPVAEITSAPVDPVGTVVPAPTGLAGVVQGVEVAFTWTNPDPLEGDTYLWRSVDALTEGPFTETDVASATVPAAASGSTCLEVVTRRAGKTSPTPVGACAP